MTPEEAISLIKPGVSETSRIWADIGAGTGMFTVALRDLLGGLNGDSRLNRRSRIYAVDKSPHALWQLQSTAEVEIVVVEADFNNSMDLPPLDGIVMANALHYATDHRVVLEHVLKSLKQGGTFILVEYDTDRPNPPWVPNPISFKTFETLCGQSGLSAPKVIGSVQSQYGYERIYAAVAMLDSQLLMID
jgi:SAM-dependent methyltransferase